MPTYAALVATIRDRWTARNLKRRLAWNRIPYPAQLSDMLWTEEPEYVAAAILAIQTVGA